MILAQAIEQFLTHLAAGGRSKHTDMSLCGEISRGKSVMRPIIRRMELGGWAGETSAGAKAYPCRPNRRSGVAIILVGMMRRLVVDRAPLRLFCAS